MIESKTILGIIPARGGSKRLPNKNLRILGEKPLIAHTISAANGSAYLDEVLVSTDDPEIAKISTSEGAHVPFMRPSQLAQDDSATIDVIFHALSFYGKRGQSFEYVALLQPTSPLRGTREIDEAIEFMISKKADAVVSVTEAEHSPLWSNILPPTLSMTGFLREDIINKRSQDLPKYYRLNGAIYICSSTILLKYKTFFAPKNIFAYIMPQEKSVDVDTDLDMKLCEVLMQERMFAAMS
jgi:CMP-N-acetylneuraminic acid synthetase